MTLACVYLGPWLPCTSQNLVENPDFEFYSVCPTVETNGGPLEAIPWLAVGGTSDYFNECASPVWFGVPVNFRGFQQAHSGVAYAGMYTRLPESGYREFLQALLLSPLEADQCYHVSAWINHSNVTCANDQFGILLTEGSPSNFIGLDPQINWGGGLITDTIGWTYVSGYFTAAGNENYITLGNFRPNNETNLDPACDSPIAPSYYYVDDVIVELSPALEVDIDLGDNVVSCDSFIIDPLDNDDINYHWSTGHIGTTLTVYATGNYSAIGYWDCKEGFGEIDVIIQQPVFVDIGPDQIYLCEGELYEITLDPLAGSYLWDDGSTEPVYSISEAGTYYVEMDDGCVVSMDTMSVITAELPVDFTLGSDTSLCPGDTLHFTFDPAAGQFEWQDGSALSQYTISTSGVYALSISNLCGSRTDELIITEGISPVLALGADTVFLCDNEMFTINLDTVPWIFQWNDGTTGPLYMIDTVGLYKVTATNNCGMDFDSILVLAAFLPSINLGADIQACPGDTIYLNSGIQDEMYQWSDGSTLPALQVTASGIYAVTVTNECGIDSDSIEVIFTLTSLQPNLGVDRVLCPGDTALLDPDMSAVSYLWTDGSVNPQLAVTSPGVYCVTVSNSCGMGIDSIFIEAGEPLPQLELGSDISLCQGDTFLITPVFDHVSSWLWHDGDTDSTYTVFSSGIISVEVNNSCAGATDTIMVFVLPAVPALDLGPDVTMCPGEESTFAIQVTGVTILWSDNSADPVLTVSDSAIVFATIRNLCGESADTVEVSVFPETPSLDLGQDQAICPGESLIYNPGIPGVSYLWQDGSTNTSYVATHAETIILSISDACGVDVDSVNLIESTDGPYVDLGPDIVGCEGDQLVVDAGISGVQYLWQDGSAMNQLLVLQSGSYSLTVSNACGTDVDSIDVVLIPIPPAQSLGPDTTLCEGQTLMLTANVAPGVQTEWQDFSTANNFTIIQPGLYHVTASNVCGIKSDSVLVTILNAPAPFALGEDTILCPGETVLLKSPSLDYHVEWQDGSMASAYLVDHSGIYTLELSNLCGSIADTIEVNFNDEFPEINFETNYSFCKDNPLVLDATQPFPASYLWSTGESSSVIVVSESGFFSVQVSALCSTIERSTEVLLDANCDEDPVFYIPNIFSPDGDGINDDFTLSTSIPENIIAIKCNIFDRWGNLIFGSDDTKVNWDGSLNGDPMAPGVYVYMIQVQYFINGIQTEASFAGDVMLIR